jgi:hypothetical protein
MNARPRVTWHWNARFRRSLGFYWGDSADSADVERRSALWFLGRFLCQVAPANDVLGWGRIR